MSKIPNVFGCKVINMGSAYFMSKFTMSLKLSVDCGVLKNDRIPVCKLPIVQTYDTRW